MHPTPCVTFYFKLQMKTVNLPLRCCKTTILTDKNAPKLRCIFSKLLFLPPDLSTYISVLGTAEAITVLYLHQLFTVTFRKCVSRQDIFFPFGLICFTYFSLEVLILSVGQILPTLFHGHIWSKRLSYMFACQKQSTLIFIFILILDLLYVTRLFPRHFCQQLLRWVESRHNKLVAVG